MPVPGPTRMQGKLGSGGSRKEGALARETLLGPLSDPVPPILTDVGCAVQTKCFFLKKQQKYRERGTDSQFIRGLLCLFYFLV
jgi:hypothetical protein